MLLYAHFDMIQQMVYLQINIYLRRDFSLATKLGLYIVYMVNNAHFDMIQHMVYLQINVHH